MELNLAKNLKKAGSQEDAESAKDYQNKEEYSMLGLDKNQSIRPSRFKRKTTKKATKQMLNRSQAEADEMKKEEKEDSFDPDKRFGRMHSPQMARKHRLSYEDFLSPGLSRRDSIGTRSPR